MARAYRVHFHTRLLTHFYRTQPAVLTLLSGGTPMSLTERDVRRADAIKRRLAVIALMQY